MSWFTDKKHQETVRLLNLILKKQEELLSVTNQGLLDLEASIAALTTQDAAVVAALNTLVSTQTSLQAQIAALQAQLAAGTEVTDAQLETLAQTSNAAQTAVAAALTAATPPAPAPAVKKA